VKVGGRQEECLRPDGLLAARDKLSLLGTSWTLIRSLLGIPVEFAEEGLPVNAQDCGHLIMIVVMSFQYALNVVSLHLF
jgi:hypothetical protein